jgi:hypothetical protein
VNAMKRFGRGLFAGGRLRRVHENYEVRSKAGGRQVGKELRGGSQGKGYRIMECLCCLNVH